jgi:hypothetical protein
MLGSGARLAADETARAFILLGALGLAALVARAAADPANDQGRQKEPYHCHPLPFVELEQNVPKSYRGTIYAGLAPGVKREVGASGQARGRAHETAVWAPLDSRPSTARALGYQVLIEDVATYFADGAPQASGARVDAIALTVDETGAGNGFRFRFTADPHSRVAWNEDAGYSMFDARWRISTIAAQITGLGP